MYIITHSFNVITTPHSLHYRPMLAMKMESSVPNLGLSLRVSYSRKERTKVCCFTYEYVQYSSKRELP